MTVNLGDKARDTITGFEGIVVSMTAHLNGCIHVGLEGPAKGDDAKRASLYELYDIQRVEVIEAGAYKPQDHGVNPPGGPSDGRAVRVEDHRRA